MQRAYTCCGCAALVGVQLGMRVCSCKHMGLFPHCCLSDLPVSVVIQFSKCAFLLLTKHNPMTAPYY